MDGERRADYGAMLLDLRDRTTRIEARGEARDVWQANTTSEIKELRGQVSHIEAKLDALMAEIAAGKAVARAGGSLAGWVLKLVPVGAIGAAIASVFHYLWPAR